MQTNNLRFIENFTSALGFHNYNLHSDVRLAKPVTIIMYYLYEDRICYDIFKVASYAYNYANKLHPVGSSLVLTGVKRRGSAPEKFTIYERDDSIINYEFI